MTGDWSGNGTTGVGVYLPADDVFALAVLSPGKYAIAQQIVDPYGYHTNNVLATPLPPTLGQPGGINAASTPHVAVRPAGSGPVGVPSAIATSSANIVVPSSTSPPASSTSTAAKQTTVTIRKRVVPQTRAAPWALSAFRWKGDDLFESGSA